MNTSKNQRKQWAERLQDALGWTVLVGSFGLGAYFGLIAVPFLFLAGAGIAVCQELWDRG